MTLDELKELIAGGESDRLEFKETTGQRGEVCRTLCAFLNGDGGAVVFGVSRKGKLTGQLVSDETKKDLARAFCDFEPGIEIPTGLTGKTGETLGVYEGAGYCAKGLYRPWKDCTMKEIRYNHFCPVCKRAVNRMLDYCCD